MLKAKLVTKLFHMYMPPIAKHNDRVGMVELFLSGSRKFRGLFDCVEGEIHNGKPLIIPRQLHNIADREITIGKKCVSLSLLTQKNLTNTINIKPDCLLIHVNDVKKNCKKSFPSLSISRQSL